jgi:hypothetical protein
LLALAIIYLFAKVRLWLGPVSVKSPTCPVN